MRIDYDDLNAGLHPDITGEQLLWIIFGSVRQHFDRERGKLVRRNAPHIDNAEDQFKQWVRAAIRDGELKNLNKTYSSVPFEKYLFKTNTAHGWLKSKKIVERLTAKMVKVHPKIIRWIESYREPDKTFKNLETTAGESATKPQDFFPAPEGTTWNKVRITITGKGQVKISISGKVQTFHLEKFKEVFPHETCRDLLFQIIQSGGTFDKSVSKKSSDTFKKYVSNLRKELSELFGILDDPLPNVFPGEYKTAFKVSCDYVNSPDEETQLTPEENTPAGVKTNKDPYQ